MIQIRHGLFETNSSSANVLIIPKSQGIHVPHRFFYMDDGTSLKPSEKVIYSILHGWNFERDNVDKIVNFLYINGVEEIVYGGHNPYFEEAVNKYKDRPEDIGVPDGWTNEELKFALFGNSSEIEHFEDGQTRPNYSPAPEYKQLDQDDENWYREYSAEY